MSYEAPSFHGAFSILIAPSVSQRLPRFAQHAGADEAHEATIKCGKGTAMLTIHCLTDPPLVEDAKREFEQLEEE